MGTPISLPPTLPTMVLQGITPMPQAMVPLYIFEERYREMLRDCLAGERLFCVATAVGPEVGDPAEGEVLPYSTAGVIRACVGQEDGTSHLVLEGLRRIELLGWAASDKPYKVATIRDLGQPPADDPNRTKGLLAEVIEMGQKFDLPRETRERLAENTSPAVATEILAATFLSNPEDQQGFLGATSLEAQLAILRANIGNRL